MDNSIISTPRTYKSDFIFWLMWVIASMAAIMISAGVLIGLISIATTISPGINEDRLAGGIMFPITATMLGVGQWLVLRSRVPKSGWWILATIVGMLAAIALPEAVIQVFSRVTDQEWNTDFQHGMLMTFVIIGFVIALAQLPILWRYLRSPILWLLLSMIGWFIMGLIVGVSIDRTSDIIAVGVIPAIFTGFGLIGLMRNPRIEPEHSP
jgi:hypothetical protein